MIITHKTECYPNQEQRQIIEQNFGMRRFFFNKSIIYFKKKYGNLKENKKFITRKELLSLGKNLFRSKHKELTKSCPSVILDTALQDVQAAFDSLWKKGKQIDLRKKKSSNTCRWHRKNETSFRYENGSKYISTTRLENLKLAESLRWNNADIKLITIKKFANRFFISITCKIDDYTKQNKKENDHLSIDWGIKTYLTVYNGLEFFKVDFNPRILNKLDKNIAKYQKKISRKQLKSNNFKKVTTKLQQAYLDFDNYRFDFIKQVVNNINVYYDSVTIENLGMSFVTRNKKLAHKAKQKPFYLFKKALIDKFNQFGKFVYEVSKTFPSTQTCSNCGHIKTGKNKMKLGESSYHCPKCKKIFNRDENACINLYQQQLCNLDVATI